MVASRVGGRRPHSAKSPVATTASWDLERANVGADPTAISGKVAVVGEASEIRSRRFHRGNDGSTRGNMNGAQQGKSAIVVGSVQFHANGEPVRASAGGRRWRMGSYYR